MKMSKLLSTLSIFAIATQRTSADFAPSITMCNNFTRESQEDICVQGWRGDCVTRIEPQECYRVNTIDCTRYTYEKETCGVIIKNPNGPSGFMNGINNFINGVAQVMERNFSPYLGCLWQTASHSFTAMPARNFTCIPPNVHEDRMESEDSAPQARR